MEPRIFIIILNLNGREETIECLRSVQQIDYANLRVIVVDNASTDGSPEEIAQQFPAVKLIKNKTNAGYDGGNNIGIRDALREGADAVLILNNDTVVDSGILRAFSEAAATLPRAGILGAAIYYFEEPEVFWWAGCRGTRSKTGWLSVYTQEGKGETDRGQYDEIRKVDGVIGCAMYIRREVFKKSGFFDERFFIYHEEYDFCNRAAAACWECYVVPGAKVWHKVARSMGGSYSPSFSYFWTRNWLLLSRKYTSCVYWPLLYCAYLKESLWVYQGLREKEQPHAAEAALAGAWSALLNRFGPIGKLSPPRWLSRLAAWHYHKNTAQGS